MKEKKDKQIAQNRRARFEYEILETFEAGIELTGTEVRSLRDKNCQLTDCYCLIRGGEMWLYNVHIAPFEMGNINNVDPDRRRKLLLHKNQIRYLERQVAEVEIARARGKKVYDKRATMAKRDSNREIERALKERSRY